MLEENPPWKIIPCWSLDREINWPSNWPVLEAVATTAKRWSNGGWENNVNWSERDRRTRADKRTSDRLNPMNERDTRWNWDGPITRLHPFAWDVQRWWHDISDISPWIHSISVDRKSMCIQSPRTATSAARILTQITSGIFGYFRHVFHVSREIDSHEEGEDSCTSRPRNYDALSEMENGGVIHHRIERSWNRLELAWFNFAFQLRDLFVPFWILKHLDRIQPFDREKRNEISIRPGNDDEFKRCCHWGNIVRGNWLEWNNINLEFKQLYY